MTRHGHEDMVNPKKAQRDTGHNDINAPVFMRMIYNVHQAYNFFEVEKRKTLNNI